MDNKLKRNLVALWLNVWLLGLIGGLAGAQHANYINFGLLSLANACVAAIIVMQVFALIKRMTTKRQE